MPVTGLSKTLDKLKIVGEKFQQDVVTLSHDVLDDLMNKRGYKNTQNFNYSHASGNGVVFGNNAPWMVFIENGSKEKRPVNAKCLHWVSNGRHVFSMFSPAIPANPIVGKASQEIERRIEILFELEWRQVFK